MNYAVLFCSYIHHLLHVLSLAHAAGARQATLANQRAMAPFPPVAAAIAAASVAFALLPPLTAAQPSCSYTSFDDTLLFQGDLPHQPVASNVTTLDECAAACCRAGYPCATFSLTADGACYLKQRRQWVNTSAAGTRSGVLTSPAPKPVQVFPWFNASLPTEARLGALLDAMTLPEQIS